jgi:hypothetical protein
VRHFRLHPPNPRLVENDVEHQCLDLLRLKRYRPERLHAGLFKSLDYRRFIKGHPKGTPDYIVAHPTFPAFYLEVKRPGETASPEQEQKHVELQLCGFAVATVDSIDALVAWLDINRKASPC